MWAGSQEESRMTDRRGRPLKVGLLLPDTEGQLEGRTPRWRDLEAMARAAEDVGFDSVWITDHLIHRPDAETPPDGAVQVEVRGPWEGWTLLTALAAVTEQVEVGPLVLSASFRNPGLLAKMADTLDEVSDGRLILGLGAGWNEPEYRAFGFPFDHRVDRFEEAIRIIAGLLHGERVDVDGRYWQAHDAELRPRGPRPNGPPILIGTTGKRMLDITARYADMWNVWFSNFGNDVDRLPPLLAEVDAACERGGRDPATLAKTAAIVMEVGPHAPSSMEEPFIRGTPPQLADSLRAHAAIGLAQVQVWLEPPTMAGIEAFAPTLDLLDRG
jgi:probable F420-dependent oxidoreductase